MFVYVNAHMITISSTDDNKKYNSSFKIPRSCLRPSSPFLKNSRMSYGTERIIALVLPRSHIILAMKIYLKRTE